MDIFFQSYIQHSCTNLYSLRLLMIPASLSLNIINFKVHFLGKNSLIQSAFIRLAEIIELKTFSWSIFVCFLKIFIYSFIFGCVGSLLLCVGFL